jgi:hypothetical protein
MESTDFKIIKIKWLEKKSYDLESIKTEQTYKNCLYQAYGDSPIYGRDALLYIGQTNDFIRRTTEHIKSDFNRINNLSLIAGEVEFQNQFESKEKILNAAEALLITMLKPSYNSANVRDTDGLLKGENKVLVLNLENRGVLPLEVSNYWW